MTPMSEREKMLVTKALRLCASSYQLHRTDDEKENYIDHVQNDHLNAVTEEFAKMGFDVSYRGLNSRLRFNENI